jgi:hypothetical protein
MPPKKSSVSYIPKHMYTCVLYFLWFSDVITKINEGRYLFRYHVHQILVFLTYGSMKVKNRWYILSHWNEWIMHNIDRIKEKTVYVYKLKMIMQFLKLEQTILIYAESCFIYFVNLKMIYDWCYFNWLDISSYMYLLYI